MSPTATSSKKGGGRGGSAAGKKGAKGSTSSGRGTGKRSASAALAEDDHSGGTKRAKRSTSGRKSLREEELGVGAELADDDIEGEGGEEEGDEEEDEEGDGGVTRCVCGQDNEEMASGLMIQCDTCKCWQHGACVGLWDEKECPNRYFCELCKPSLHGPGGLLRKVSRKSSAPAAGRSGSPTSTRDTSGKGHKPRESADAAMMHAFLYDHTSDHKLASSAFPASTASAPKKRNTMNSRDAAYDDAIALSILEHGTAAMRAKLEKGRNGEGSGSEGEGSEDEEDEVEEIIISGAGGRGKGKQPVGAKAGAKGKAVVTAKKGGVKGRTGPRNRRSPSNAEDESPAPDGDDDDIELKEETVDAAENALSGQGDGADEGAEGVEEEQDGTKRRKSVSEERRDEDEHEEEKAKEDEEHAAGESGMAQDEKVEDEVAEPEALREPSPVPAHSGGRGKHPNQYTYRGRGGHGAHGGRGGKSPIKRGGASHASFSSQGTGEASGSSGKNGGGAATSNGAFGWGLPEHLRHLAPLLPSQSPQLIEVPSVADPTAPPTLEPPTKVRFPGKRVTMPEMRKRARTVLEFLTKVQVEMSERGRRWEVLRDANERIKEAREKERPEEAGSSSGRASTSGSAEGSGSRSSSATAVDFTLAALPPLPGASSAPLLRSAASSTSLAMMDRLAKEVIRFQERFFGVVE
ncbi:transcriptional regulator Cti6 [Rhodotorula toruloides]|uniref:Transcriptional regulator Cti6 n=1 Tax=Rhodotorula toruloides TaxID=5286 RepID=A0A511KCB7_RHOTO|nr:transcriptional regulator Cti6 [Rhodotorula toruloides]